MSAVERLRRVGLQRVVADARPAAGVTGDDLRAQGHSGRRTGQLCDRDGRLLGVEAEDVAVQGGLGRQGPAPSGS
jgi:hypothetical protein